MEKRIKNVQIKKNIQNDKYRHTRDRLFGLGVTEYAHTSKNDPSYLKSHSHW